MRTRAKVRAFLITHAHEDHVGGLPTCCPTSRACRSTPRRWRAACWASRSRSTSSRTTRSCRSIPATTLQIGPFRVRAVPDQPLDPGRDGHRPPHAGRDRRHDRRLQVRPHPRRRPPLRLRHAVAARRRRRHLPAVRLDARREPRATRLSERTVGEAFREIMEPLDGRVIVATFASNIARIQQVLDAAATFDRKVAVVGRSMEQNFRIATDLGYLTYPPGQIVGKDQIGSTPPDQHRHRHDRRPGRADGRPRPHGQPRPSLRRDPAGRHGHRQRQPDPRQRGVRGPHHRQPVQGRRQRLLPRHQARARLRSRQPGRAQADARADAAEVLHPDPRRVPDAGPARPAGRSRRAWRPENVFIIENGQADRVLRRRHRPARPRR